MRLSDSIRRSSRSLLHAKSRTILTVAAIAVGSFALSLTIAAGTGARQFVDRLITNNFDPQELIVTKNVDLGQAYADANGIPREYDASYNSFTREQLLTQEDITRISQLQGVESVRKTYAVDAEYITAPSTAKKFIAPIGVYNPHMRPETVSGGLSEVGQGKIVLPESYVSVLGLGNPNEAIGQIVTLHYKGGPAKDQVQDKEFIVAAVSKKPNVLLGGSADILLSDDDSRLLYDFQNAGTLQYDTFASVNVRVAHEDSLGGVQNLLKFNGFAALSAKDVAQQVTQAVNVVQYGIAGFGIIALITSIFGIVNTQLISVLERTREIGLMKALGMGKQSVYRLFVLEATWIGFGGAVVGIFLAYLLSLFANPWIEEHLQLGGDLLQFTPLPLGLLVVALMLIAAVAGVLPAWKASRLNPVEALRTE